MHTLDTNAIIYYLNGEASVVQSMEDIFDQGTPRYVSTITVLELFSRPELSQQDKDDIERLLGSLFVIPYMFPFVLCGPDIISY